METIEQNIDYLEQKNGNPFSTEEKHYLRGSVCQKEDGTCYRMSEQEFYGREIMGC